MSYMRLSQPLWQAWHDDSLGLHMSIASRLVNVAPRRMQKVP